MGGLGPLGLALGHLLLPVQGDVDGAGLGEQVLVLPTGLPEGVPVEGREGAEGELAEAPVLEHLRVAEDVVDGVGDRHRTETLRDGHLIGWEPQPVGEVLGAHAADLADEALHVALPAGVGPLVELLGQLERQLDLGRGLGLPVGALEGREDAVEHLHRGLDHALVAHDVLAVDLQGVEHPAELLALGAGLDGGVVGLDVLLHLDVARVGVARLDAGVELLGDLLAVDGNRDRLVAAGGLRGLGHDKGPPGPD